MRKLICEVIDSDPFSRELISGFINKTPELLMKSDHASKANILFIDAELNHVELKPEDYDQIVIISANEKFIHSLFQDKIADFLYKPDLSYSRFKQAIQRVIEKAGDNGL